MIILENIVNVNLMLSERFLMNTSEIPLALQFLTSSIVKQDSNIKCIALTTLETNFSESIIKDSINQMPRGLPVILIDWQNTSLHKHSEGRHNLKASNYKPGSEITISKDSLVVIFGDNLERVSKKYFTI